MAAAAAAAPRPAGESEKKINAPHVVRLLHQAGTAAVMVHGRTMEQRYKKAADWGLISQLVAQQDSSPPQHIIGNGDILTHYEAADRWQAARCSAVLVGRGALIKPWIFQEIREVRVVRANRLVARDCRVASLVS